MNRFLCAVILSLATFGSGCGSGGSGSGHVTVSAGLQQHDLEGTWSGTLTSEDGTTSTLVVDIDRHGFIVYGLASDGSLVVTGDLLLDHPLGDVSFGLLTSSGQELFGEGTVSIDAEIIHITVLTEQGLFADLVLWRTFGPGTFFVSDLAGSHDIELVEPFFAGVRVGDVTLGIDGSVAGSLDGLEIIDGGVWIDDDSLGLFTLELLLENGELVIIDGIVSLADLVLAGRYTDDFVVGGAATLLPW